MKKISLNTQVILALFSSVIFAWLYHKAGIDASYTDQWIGPIGVNFMHALKLLVVPLVICSVVVSVNSARNTAQLSRIGTLTFGLYMVTTIFAVSLGLLLGYMLTFLPWKATFSTGDLSLEAINKAKNIVNPKDLAQGAKKVTAWIPENIILLLQENTMLTQSVLFALLFGIAMLGIDPKRRKFVLIFFEGMQDILNKLLGFVMRFSPIGIFGIIFTQLVKMLEDNSNALAQNIPALAAYTTAVIIGLAVMTFLVYPIMVRLFSNVSPIRFIKTMFPAQLVGFSSASSTASLYVTTRQVGKLGVADRIRGFVLTLGATVNMDGTALYQGVVMFFVMHGCDFELSFSSQLYIIFFVTISSIGVSGTPGASIITTSLLLQNLGIGQEQCIAAIALTLLPDRLLDMCRTATNITGDSTVAILVDQYEENRAKKYASLHRKQVS